MPVVDAHVHFGPGLGNHTYHPLLAVGSAAELVALLDESGIDMCCAFAPSWEGGDFDDPDYSMANRAIYEATRSHSDRVIGVCRVNPNLGRQPLDEMRRCREEYGFRALKLHPDSEYFYIGSATMRPVMDRAAEYGWPVILHTGFYPLSQPALVLPVAAEYPTLPFLLAHIGHRLAADAIIVAQRAANVFLETAGDASAAVIAEVLRTVGPDRLIFGSNAPYGRPSDVLSRIRALPQLDADTTARVLGGTMARLLGLASTSVLRDDTRSGGTP